MLKLLFIFLSKSMRFKGRGISVGLVFILNYNRTYSN